MAGTYFRTFSASPAFVPVKHQARPSFQIFRVVAPKAPQWASGEKHCRPDAVAVVYGKSFDVRNECHTLLPEIFATADISVLFCGRKVVPQNVPATDPYLKITVFLRMCLRITQGLRTKNIAL